MKIKEKIISVLLMVVMMLSSVLTILANESETTSKKIGQEFLEEIGVSYEDLISGNYEDVGEKYSCIIWIKDVDLELAEEAGIQAAEQIQESNLKVAELTDGVIDENVDDQYVQTYIDAERAKAVELYTDSNTKFVAENFKARDTSVNYVSKYSPCIFADLTITQIENMVSSTDVDYIGLLKDADVAACQELDPSYMSASDVQTCLEIMRVDEAKSAYGITGSGVKIGLIDGTCPASTDVIRDPCCTPTETEGATEHADMVYSILHTVAPNATYYASGYYERTSITQYTYYGQIEWLISSGVNIISSSFGFFIYNEETNTYEFNVYDELTRWIDHIAYNHDVHFIQAGGNQGAQGIVLPGMGYNVITVGNTDWTDTYEIDVNSSYNNEGISRTNQRTYKPDVVAPASCTSYATPMVSGTVALLCELNPALKTKQPIVKSILAAGAGATTGSYVTIDTEFKQYGAGIVDALASSYIVAANQYSTSTGILSATVGEIKSYSMEVSSSDSRMRIAMTYSNRISLQTSSSTHATETIPDGTIAEVGLYVYDPNGNLVAACVGDTRVVGSNTRIVEFDTNGNTGTYIIKVRMLSPASGGRYTNFGVAWW